MQIKISEAAAKWYKEELDLVEPSFLRFHVRYGGMGGNIPGFSLGIAVEEPTQIYASTKVEGLTFYIEESDHWYFEDKNLRIELDETLHEPQFVYEAT